MFTDRTAGDENGFLCVFDPYCDRGEQSNQQTLKFIFLDVYEN